MNLSSLLRRRLEAGRPVRVALIGAGKFGSMFLAQVPTIAGLEVAIIADLDPDRARGACRSVGWDETRIAATRFSPTALRPARRRGRGRDRGDRPPVAGIAHALAAIEAGRHIVMVNVEADVLAGAAPCRQGQRARRRLFDGLWRPAGARRRDGRLGARRGLHGGRGRAKAPSIFPHYHGVTPDDVWTHYGLTPEEAKAAGMNPQMFNSFLDGTKSAIEMAAIANACDLDVPEDGLLFPPCGVDDLAHVLRPRAVGGQLERRRHGRGRVLARA